MDSNTEVSKVDPETGWEYPMLEHGYIVSDAEGTMELQRLDELGKYTDDRAAAEQFKQDLLVHDPYAMDCLLELMQDWIRSGGVGRNGEPHDMDYFNIWEVVP